jgi:hypothetical protein
MLDFFCLILHGVRANQVVAMAPVAKLLWAEVKRARWTNSSRQWGALVKYVGGMSA